MIKINVTINNEKKELEVKPYEKLVDALRRYGYKGTKKGCYEGTCGACVVLLNNKAVNSCLILAPAVENQQITTIEGIGTMNKPHPLQESIVEAGGVQCGYCTPGFIMSAYALLLKNPEPTEEEIKRATDGNLCRCTGYVKKIEGVLKAVEKMRGGK